MSMMPTAKQRAIEAAVAKERARYNSLVKAALHDIASRDAMIATLRATAAKLDSLVPLVNAVVEAGRERDRFREHFGSGGGDVGPYDRAVTARLIDISEAVMKIFATDPKK